jgi:hypothetical protein
VEGGPARTLLCVGEIGETRLVFLQKKIDFGHIPVGASLSLSLCVCVLCHFSLNPS